MSLVNFPTIGADPEVFVKKKSTGELYNAFGLVPGDKWEPHKVENGAVQVDGIALEFNIDPSNNRTGFLANLESVSRTLKDMVGEEYEFLTDASVKFDESWARKQPPDSLMMGCMPDWNAWTGKINEPPCAEAMMRTAGGHIHLGFFTTEDEFENVHLLRCATLAKLLDEEIGAYSILWDQDDERRKLYGLAGSFRPKKYGMEYRTLSNAWIFDRKLSKFVWDGAERAMNRYRTGDHHVPEHVEEIINESLRDHMFFEENKDIAEKVDMP